jgi:hypothetical protein
MSNLVEHRVLDDLEAVQLGERSTERNDVLVPPTEPKSTSGTIPAKGPGLIEMCGDDRTAHLVCLADVHDTPLRIDDAS